MPEGDSIHKMASRIRPDVAGKPIIELYMRDRGVVGPMEGRTIETLDVHGKHMLFRIAPSEDDRRRDGWVLRVHLGMYGSWRRFYVDSGLRPPTDAVVTVTTEAARWACLRGTAELKRTKDLRLEGRLSRLGPDLLAPEFDVAEAVGRARRQASADCILAELLLDQRIAAGIGNVYKSEVLFLCGQHPERHVGDLTDDELTELYREAQRLMASNMDAPGRATAGEFRGLRRRAEASRYYVYRRRTLPCFRCKAAIECRRYGSHQRSTYFCPRCQRAP